MSSPVPVTKAYTRSAILAWANTILGGSLLTLQDIPCHDVALLLYGVFSSAASPTAAQRELQASDDGNHVSSIPLLCAAELHAHDARHHSTCMRYLQLVQFPAAKEAIRKASATSRSYATGPAPALSGASPVAGEERSGNNAVTQQRNAEHVLAFVRALSSEEAELLRASSLTDGDSKREDDVDAERAIHTGNNANVVLLLGPSMTASAWLSGSAFVEELKLWRWVRLMADRHRCTVQSIRSAISAYLQQDATTQQSAPPATAPTTACLDAEKRERSSPQAPEDEDGVADSLAMVQVRSVAGSNAKTSDASEIAQELKRMRLEASQSPAPAPMSTSSMAMLNRSMSPIHSLLSPIRDADRRVRSENEGLSSSSEAAAAAKAALAVHEATEATVTPYVARAPPLQSTLREAQAALEQAFRDAAAAAAAVAVTAVDAESSSTHSSTGAAGNSNEGAAQKAARHPTLPVIHNGSESQEVMCRQRMVAQVFANTTDTDGHVQANESEDGGGMGGATSHPLASRSSAAALTAPPSCDVCPAVMAHAIQCNLNAIDALEEVRAKAIAACLKKDPVALLAALQNIV
ncbi:hypothetical protein ABL78_0236 [Leptomonas seymouri]|uniref:Uncharacterized protein n=1 Tax=Leptomonas seymouri TaxID=5684 RepID=A0A0N1IML5_LEPSE|nr:hypothetical protein ABL78_0236 [Leptomonas seymouri]|eukprot:KPI90640.1 hypothetical protein ABL78_0236 [Leptomonas seymouri]